MDLNKLPRPYQLLAEINEYTDLIEDGTYTGAGCTSNITRLVQELTRELWVAGMSERHAGMGTNDSDHDAPLWARGAFLEEVTAAVGVPTVQPSDPARDLGRGRALR